MAEVRLADSGGDSVWACLEHAHEILFAGPSAFLAGPGEQGISAYLSRRR
jgi:hypothetical protein